MNGLARRDALALGAGVAASTVLHANARPVRRRLDPTDPNDARSIVRKLRFRTDSGLIFSWIKGPYMAAIAGDLIPMYALNVGAIQRVVQRADGGFDLTDLEISFRTDVDTGKELTSFRNPVTGELLPTRPNVQGPNRLSVTRDNQVQIADVPGGARFAMTHHPSQPFQLGNETFFRDRSHTVVTMPDGSTSQLNEVSTLSGPSATVLDPAVSIVYSRVQSNDVRSWPAWLKMGNRPGTMSLFGNGGKVARFGDLPQDFLEMLDRFAPEIARDPVAALVRAPKQSAG